MSLWIGLLLNVNKIREMGMNFRRKEVAAHSGCSCSGGVYNDSPD